MTCSLMSFYCGSSILVVFINAKEKLSINGHNKEFINRSKKPSRPKKFGPNKKVYRLQIPFIDDRTEKKLQEAIIKSGFNVQLTRKNRTLRQALAKGKIKGCRLGSKCPVGNTDICCLRRVVYKIVCSCKETYIGSTVRELHDRVNEHYKDAGSTVGAHKRACHGALSIKILARGKDRVDLQIKEAIHIKKQNPSLNSKQELVHWEKLI